MGVWQGLPRWQRACWERRRAEQLNYLVVRRDLSSEAERREHFITVRKKTEKSLRIKLGKRLEELCDWLSADELIQLILLQHKAKKRLLIGCGSVFEAVITSCSSHRLKVKKSQRKEMSQRNMETNCLFSVLLSELTWKL